MGTVASEKLAQATALVAASDLDAWVIFVRETSDGPDPVLPLILESGLTWQSALILTGTQRAAVVGSYDADPLRASGEWPLVVPYVEDIREPLLSTLEALVAPGPRPPRLGVNFSPDDPKADGLTYGMFRVLCGLLEGSRFEGCLESAEDVARALRAGKTPAEVECMRAAIRETESLFDLLAAAARSGVSERELFDLVQAEVDRRRLGYGWDRTGNPIVNCGPDSMIGHGVPSSAVRLAPGHILHVDLGVTVEGYSSDIQRCWYVLRPGEDGPPERVLRAMEAVTAAITAGAEALRPGVQGWEVDAAARATLTGAGWPDFGHAFGHQVGRAAHDGGGILGPRWPRYGQTPQRLVEADQVFTLELGVVLPEHGYLGIEEMVLVTEQGLDWLTSRQTGLWLIEAA